jgi:hypothetical protein
MKKLLRLGFLVAAVSFLGGCAAIGTSVSHRELVVQSKMSHTIFLPVDAKHADHTLYLQVRNTSDKIVSLEGGLYAALKDKGYSIVATPSRAHYILQVNLLQIGQASNTAANEMMGSGYGGAIEGGVGGIALGAATGSNAAVTGIVGAIAGSIVDNMVKNVTFTGITDVKITVRGEHEKSFQTRIMTTANQVNLKFSEAEPMIIQGLTRSISGLF